MVNARPHLNPSHQLSPLTSEQLIFNMIMPSSDAVASYTTELPETGIQTQSHVVSSSPTPWSTSGASVGSCHTANASLNVSRDTVPSPTSLYPALFTSTTVAASDPHSSSMSMSHKLSSTPSPHHQAGDFLEARRSMDTNYGRSISGGLEKGLEKRRDPKGWGEDAFWGSRRFCDVLTRSESNMEKANCTSLKLDLAAIRAFTYEAADTKRPAKYKVLKEQKGIFEKVQYPLAASYNCSAWDVKAADALTNESKRYAKFAFFEDEADNSLE
jgi:hypothetical protein